jgi:hypothetical protein
MSRTDPSNYERRVDRIRKALAWCEAKGIVRSWYSYSPGDGRGKRWVVEGVGFADRTYTTREAEAFVLGASEGRTTGILDAATAEPVVDPEPVKWPEGSLGARLQAERRAS